MKFWAKLRALFRRDKLDAEMAEEMRAHLELQIEENVARGMSHDEARYAALRAFGGLEQIKERARDGRGWRWLEELVGDVRYGIRMLLKAPVASGVIVLSLAIGLGANTAVFSWIRTVAFEGFSGVHDGAGLVIIEQRTASGIVQFASPAEWRDLRRETTSFTDIFAQSFKTFGYHGKAGDVRLWGEWVTANFFDVLGVLPAAGRTLRPQDDEPGRPPVAVISHGFWQREFGGRPEVVGQTLRLDQFEVTIIGVAPPDFHGAVTALSFDVWVAQGPVWRADDRTARGFQLLARLRPGVTLAQASAEVKLVLDRLAEAYPETNRGLSAEVLPRWRSSVGAEAIVVPTLGTLQVVMLLLLLVVCTNAANLLLAQATTRSKEIAIRLSLGAGRARIVRQLLTESVLLALVGVGLGLVIAFWGLEWINSIPKPTRLPIALEAHLDVEELMVSIALAVACAIGFGLAPALQSTRGNIGAALKVGGPTSNVAGHRRFQEWLVGAEVMATLVMVILAGLFVQSFQHAQASRPGFEPENLFLSSFDLSVPRHDPTQARTLTASLLERLREAPTVEAAGLATWVPLDLTFTLPAEFKLEGRAHHPDRPDQTLWYETTAGYFDALGIPLLSGRDFSPRPGKNRGPEAVVNEEFCRRYLSAGQSPLGRKLVVRNIEYEIVGVVRVGKYNSLAETPQPMAYLSFGGAWRNRLTVFVRSAASAATVHAETKKALHAVDPELRLFEQRTMRQHLDDAMILRVIPARLLAVLGPLSFVLAATGLYSVLAYAVARRTQEIGVRMTLGASSGSVVRLMLRQGMRPVVGGMGVGLLVAYFVSTRLKHQLVDVSASDVSLVGPLTMLFAAAASLACWLPARRAAKVDPMIALRAE